MRRMYSQGLASLVVQGLLGVASAASVCIPGESSFVAPPGFPTSAFSSYYFSPAEPTAQPQPALYDPVLGITFPYNLTNPKAIPTSDPDPPSFPPPTSIQASFQLYLSTGLCGVQRWLHLDTGSSSGRRSGNRWRVHLLDSEHVILPQTIHDSTKTSLSEAETCECTSSQGKW